MLRNIPASMALQQSIWQTRAWTYQGLTQPTHVRIWIITDPTSALEWEFSTCRLVCAGSCIYYVCSQSRCQEDITHGPYLLETTEERPPKFYSDEHAYCRHVEAFSQRNLTNGSDMLAAFQGMLHTLEPQLRTEFSWGLSLSHFDGALLWIPVGPLKRRTEKWAPEVGAASVAFPSWSWAGWKGAVRFRPDKHSDHRTERTMLDSAVNRLGHITSVIIWPWQSGYKIPSHAPSLETILDGVAFHGVLQFVTSVAHIQVRRLRRLFARQGINGWTLDDGTKVTDGRRTCIVLSELANPQIGARRPAISWSGVDLTGISPIRTYNVMVVEETQLGGGVFERRGLVKITRAIWEACEPEIRWVALI